MKSILMIALIVAVSSLLTADSYAQRERMSMSEGLTPQIVRKGEVMAIPDKPRPAGVDVYRGTKRIIEKPILEDLKIKERSK